MDKMEIGSIKAKLKLLGKQRASIEKSHAHHTHDRDVDHCERLLSRIDADIARFTDLLSSRAVAESA